MSGNTGPRALPALSAVASGAALDQVRMARVKRDQAKRLADQEFQDAIRAAYDLGLPVAKIAEAAGLTRSRIYQIKES